jgi:hypothetical protein
LNGFVNAGSGVISLERVVQLVLSYQYILPLSARYCCPVAGDAGKLIAI